MTIKEIFDEIASESSTNKKVEILSKYKDNELLKRVLYLANSPRVKFYIKQIPEYQSGPFNQELSVALDSLTPLSLRELTGHAAINHLAATLEFCSEDDAYIIERIIEKDCKINLGTTLMNKVFPKLIEETAYQGAKAYSDKLVKKLFENGKQVFTQIKADGRYCNAIVFDGDVELESRQGEPTIITGAKFLQELSTLDDCVLNGELIIKGMPRYQSNGIIASLISIFKKELDGKDVTKEKDKFEIKHMKIEEALNSISYVVWDTISIDEYQKASSITHYFKRLENVDELVKTTTMVSKIETLLVNTHEEAMLHFFDALKRNEEGTIIKSYDGHWKDGKPTHQIKVKKEINLDLKIVGFNYGTGKNIDVISSINVESEDGLLKTSPTGMSEDTMEYVTANQGLLLGTILEIKCSGISYDSNNDYSVLHPVVKLFRNDKLIANNLIECIEIDKASNFK